MNYCIIVLYNYIHACKAKCIASYVCMYLVRLAKLVIMAICMAWFYDTNRERQFHQQLSGALN